MMIQKRKGKCALMILADRYMNHVVVLLLHHSLHSAKVITGKVSKFPNHSFITEWNPLRKIFLGANS